MTAEVAILNRHAVALAADSAVTVSIGGREKVYNSVNKLFTLSKFAPVGIMVYGVADLTGVPWETIIKSFRAELGETTFPHLRQYAERLFAYIRAHKHMFSAEQQAAQVMQAAFLQFRDVLADIDATAEAEIEEKGAVTEQRLRRIVTDVIRRKHAEWTGAERLKGAPRNLAVRVKQNWTDQIKAVIDLVFEETPLTPLSTQRLVDMASVGMGVDSFPDNVSGVVVVGFGEDEYLPSLLAFDVEGVVLNFMKMREDANRSATVSATNQASIVPFAQREMVALFMEGIDPLYRSELIDALGDVVDELPAAVVTSMGARGKRGESIQDAVAAEASRLIDAFFRRMTGYQIEHHVDPIVTAVQALPKEEIAAMAESLVSLTSFKRRVSHAPETVGGPVDVAVISKGDGFIWIKRKHYFEPELNHHFFANYYPVATTEA